MIAIRCALMWALLFVATMGANEESSCPVCSVGVPGGGKGDTPRLFHKPNGVGTGNLVYSMLHAAAYASTRGWVYGGPLNLDERDSNAVTFVFNAGDYFALSMAELKYITSKQQLKKSSELSAIQGPPWDHTVITVLQDDWALLEKKCVTEDFPRFCYKDQVPVLDKLFPNTFLSSVRKANEVAMAGVELLYATDGRAGPRVAIHIRRGGLTEGGFSSRKHTPDTYYYSIIEIIRSRYPMAEFHGFPNLGKRVQAPSQEDDAFDGYLKRNVTLHHTTDTVMAWAHMVRADVLVMAHSVYSAVPALLNTKCVVYDPFWFGKLAHYKTIHTLREKFDECYVAADKPQVAQGKQGMQGMRKKGGPFAGLPFPGMGLH